MKYIIPTIIICLLAGTANANSVQLELENDIIAGSDRHYTHGTRITYERDDIQWFVQQNMYTPDDITADVPIVNDRPYAGVLFGGLRGTKRWKDPKSDSGFRKIYHQLEASLGMVGDNSLASSVQESIHGWSNSREPRGWKYQVDDMLWAQADIKFCMEEFTTKYVNSRFMLIGGGGSVMAHMGGGSQLMLGYNVPRFIDKPMVSNKNNFSIYAFYEFTHRHVFYNKLLESDYTNVTLAQPVSDNRFGVALKYKTVALQYSICERTREFREQVEGAKFGSVSIKVDI